MSVSPLRNLSFRSMRSALSAAAVTFLQCTESRVVVVNINTHAHNEWQHMWWVRGRCSLKQPAASIHPVCGQEVFGSLVTGQREAQFFVKWLLLGCNGCTRNKRNFLQFPYGPAEKLLEFHLAPASVWEQRQEEWSKIP